MLFWYYWSLGLQATEVNISLLVRGYVAKFGYERNRGSTICPESQKQEVHQLCLFLRRSGVAGVPSTLLPLLCIWSEGDPCLCQAESKRGPNVGTVMKYPNKGSLRVKGLILTDRPRIQFLMVGKSRWWELETSHHIVSMIRSKEQWMGLFSSLFPLIQSRIPSREWLHPQWTSINIIMTVLLGHM